MNQTNQQKGKTVFSDQDVNYLGRLARIYLSQEEIVSLTKNLGGILQYIEKLEKLNVSGIQPTSHVLPLQNVYREDQVLPSLSQEDVMKMAVSPHHGFFKVPQVIE